MWPIFKYLFPEENLEEGLRKVNILDNLSAVEERCYFICRISGYAAADGGYEEGEFLVLLCEGDETFNGGAGAVEAFHGGDGVTLSLEAFSVTPDCSKMIKCEAGCAACVVAKMVGAKDENLSGKEGTYAFWGDSVG